MSVGAPASANRGRLVRVAVVMTCTLIVLAGIFVFTLQSNAATASVTSQVHDAYAKHASDFASGNLTVLMGDYGPAATVLWTGDTRNWGGEFSNSSGIQAFFTRFLSVYPTISLQNVTYSVMSQGNGATVEGSATLIGLNVSNQSLRAPILTQTVYTRDNGVWVISSETWSFQNFFILQPFD